MLREVASSLLLSFHFRYNFLNSGGAVKNELSDIPLSAAAALSLCTSGLALSATLPKKPASHLLYPL